MLGGIFEKNNINGKIEKFNKSILKTNFWKDKLAHIDPGKLDDPHEWEKIPILDKDQLRGMSTEEFYTNFPISHLNILSTHIKIIVTLGKHDSISVPLNSNLLIYSNGYGMCISNKIIFARFQ